MIPTATPDAEQTRQVDKSAQRVRRMFSDIEGRYDLLNRLLSLGIDRSWRRRAVRLAPPRGSAPILDICTGTGDLALAYRRAADPQAPIMAADFCRPMLSIGAGKSARAALAGPIQFVEADALRLPFADAMFQIVSVAFGLRNVGQTDEALQEMARVCRNGGSVVVLEFSMPSARPMRALYRWYFHQVVPRVGQALAQNADGA